MHASRRHIHEHRSAGDRAADAIAAAMGSWRFIIAQSVFVAVWMVANVVGVLRHWDAYPFILLNLLFSTQAAYAAPIIMMSQNRAAARDRLRDDTEAREVQQLVEMHSTLHTINTRQMEILLELRAMREEERLSE